MRTKLSEEHKERIRIAALKRKHDSATKKKISESMKGNQNARKRVNTSENA